MGKNIKQGRGVEGSIMKNKSEARGRDDRGSGFGKISDPGLCTGSNDRRYLKYY